MQIRVDGVILKEWSKWMDPPPTDRSHTMLLKSEDEDYLNFPLKMDGGK